MDEETAKAFTAVAWADPDSFRDALDDATPWRLDVLSARKENDVNGMAQAAAAAAESVIIDVMTDRRNPPQIRAANAQFVLGQAGHGEIKKIHEVVEYRKMDKNQILPMIAQRLKSIQEKDPAFDIYKLLSGVLDADSVIEAEVVGDEVSDYTQATDE